MATMQGGGVQGVATLQEGGVKGVATMQGGRVQGMATMSLSDPVVDVAARTLNTLDKGNKNLLR